MREFKFRAWHKGHKKYQAVMLYDEYPGNVFRWLSEGQEIEIMQFTGLKDVNGIDIYEEDIYINNESNFNTPFKFMVFFKDGSFVGGKNENSYGSIFESTDLIFENGKEIKQSSFIKVIGNIYQNPELINH